MRTDCQDLPNNYWNVSTPSHVDVVDSRFHVNDM